MTEKKKTAGQIVAEANANIDQYFYENYLDFKKTNSQKLMEAIHENIRLDKDGPTFAGKDFFINVLHVIDAGLGRPVNKIWTVWDCPTPIYKQSVFKFHRQGERLEFLWSIPSKQRVDDVVKDPTKYLFDKKHGDWAKMALLYRSGELHKWAKKQLGDKIDNIIISHKKVEENAR